MPLDPQMAALLVAMSGQVIDVETLTAERFRATIGDQQLATTIEPVHRVTEQFIVGAGGTLALRIYQPESLSPLPVLVYLHGGGFVLGNLDSHDNLCRAFCNALPAVVISVDYRLAPEHKFPAAIDDAYTATAWAAAHASELGADAARLVIGGDSAGGNLAAMVCQRARDSGGPTIAHQMLLYPVCDNDLQRDSYLRVGTGYFLETAMMRWFWQQYLNSPADAEQACPLNGRLNNLPSATVVTGEYDPLSDEGAAYADALATAGVDTLHLHIPGAIHGFLSFVGIAELSNQTLRRTVETIKRALN